MRFIRFIKASLIFARHQPWVDEPEWKAEDAADLGRFMAGRTGAKFRALMLNMVLRQQAAALDHKDKDRLLFEAGYCAGQKATAAVITALANHNNFTEPGELDADPVTNQNAS